MVLTGEHEGHCLGGGQSLHTGQDVVLSAWEPLSDSQYARLNENSWSSSSSSQLYENGPKLDISLLYRSELINCAIFYRNDCYVLLDSSRPF